MRKPLVLALGLGTLVLASTAAYALVRQDAPHAEVKVGTGVEKMALQGESATFKVASGTKLWVWTKVAGAADSSIQVVFEKDGKAVSQQALKVPRSPYRTHAYRTFRTGDSGTWTAKVRTEAGAELGTATFTVTVE